MKIIILASGSKGNCTYIETCNCKVLIDCGISLKQTKERLLLNGIDLTTLDAIFVTHEHIDHVMHLASIANYYQAKIFINAKSYNNLPKTVKPKIDTSLVYFIEEGQYQIKDIRFVPIKLFHDTKNTFGYLINSSKYNIAYITDTGQILPKYCEYLKIMHLIIIESNHDIEMLQNSNRTYYLKQRILSNYGHLSNNECGKILKQSLSGKTKYVVLAHLSEECNTFDLAKTSAEHAISESGFSPVLLVAKQDESIKIDLEVKCA